MHDATFLRPHTCIDSLHPMKALLLCLTLAAASGALAQSAPAVSQKEMQDTIEQLKKLQNPRPAPAPSKAGCAATWRMAARACTSWTGPASPA